MMASSWKLYDDELKNAARSKPVLYNNRIKEFRNNKVKENVWAEVATTVEGTGK